jgi:hypothetical protein
MRADYDDYCLLGCDTMWSGKVTPFSLTVEVAGSSEMPVMIEKITEHHILEDSNVQVMLKCLDIFAFSCQIL